MVDLPLWNMRKSVGMMILPNIQHVLTWWFGLVVWKSGNWWFCTTGTNLILSNPVNKKLNSTFKITITQIAIILLLLVFETLYIVPEKTNSLLFHLVVYFIATNLYFPFLLNCLLFWLIITWGIHKTYIKPPCVLHGTSIKTPSVRLHERTNKCRYRGL